MDCDKITTNNSKTVDAWVSAGPSRLNTPETSLRREEASNTAPRNLPLIALDVNSADEVRQAVKAVLKETKNFDCKEEGSDVSQRDSRDNNTQDRVILKKKCPNKALYDVVKMTIKLVEEENKRNKQPKQQRPIAKRTKRRNTRRIKTRPTKRRRYARAYTGRLANIASTKNKKGNGNVQSSDSDSDLQSLSSRSTKSDSSR